MKQKKINEIKFDKKQSIRIFLLILAVLFALSGVYIRFAWDNAIKVLEEDTIQLAETAVAGVINSRMPTILNNENITSEEYLEVKNSLSRIANNENIRFAYIYIVRESKVYIIVDSESEDSTDYIPPWVSYEEADEVLFKAYAEGNTIVSKPIRDRWGRWVSALLPIKNADGEVIAVFGMDYPYREWYAYAVNRTYMAIVIAFCVILIYTGTYYILTRNKILLIEKNKLEQTSKRLSESEFLLRSIFEQANIGIAVVKEYKFVLSKDKNRPNINPMFGQMLGRSVEELSDKDWKDFTHPDDLEADLAYFAKFQNGETNGYEMEKRFIKPDGSIVWVKMIISGLNLYNFKGTYHLCLITDITKNKELEQVLRDSEHSKTMLLDNIPGMMYRCKFDTKWTMTYVSEGCLTLTGYHPESLLYNKEISFKSIIVDEYRKLLWDGWKKSVKKNKKMSAEYEIMTANGTKKWVWEQGKAVYEDGKALMLEGLILDITDRKINEIRLKYLNEHNTLTGLPNINMLNQLINDENTNSNTVSRAIIMLNVRRFSILKSNFGYRFSEKVITDIALFLSQLASDNACTIYHIATDQFILYKNDYLDKIDLSGICENIVSNLHKNIAIKALNYNIGVIELEKGFEYDTDTVVRKAALAADNVSDSVSAAYCFFDSEMENKLNRNTAIRRALTYTVNSDEAQGLYMVYQPILDLRTGKIAGLEALARYNNKELGFVSPVEFILVAEKNQLILPLGTKIMKKVFEFAVKIAKINKTSIFVSFNISVIQLMSDAFFIDLLHSINETGVDPKMIHIEITESIFMDNYGEVNKRLYEIRGLGIKLAIDDFGTGYSSLAREKELKVNCLKIDKQFIDGLLEKGANKSITSDIISMAHKLGHSVVAEGVENEKQRQYLIKHNCDMLQGYLYSKPLEENKAIDFLVEQGDEK